MGGNCVGTGCVCVCVWEQWGLCGNRNMVEGEAKNMGKGVCVVCLNVWCNILGMMPHF